MFSRQVMRVHEVAYSAASYKHLIKTTTRGIHCSAKRHAFQADLLGSFAESYPSFRDPVFAEHQSNGSSKFGDFKRINSGIRERVDVV